MLGNTRLLALCTSAALALSAGCSPDSPTVAGPDAQSDQEGLGAGGHREISRFTRGATQISGIGYFAGTWSNVTTPRVRIPTMTSS